MQKIELTGAVGEEIELSYKGDAFVVKLDEHGIVPDITAATIKAMKKDANAFLYAAQLIYRGNISGESHAKDKVAGVVKKMFDEIKPAKPKVEAAKPAAKTEKKVVEEAAPAKAEEKVVEEAPAAKSAEPPKVEEPKPATKTEATEKKSESTETTKKTSATAAKKTTTTKRKSA